MRPEIVLATIAIIALGVQTGYVYLLNKKEKRLRVGETGYAKQLKKGDVFIYKGHVHKVWMPFLSLDLVFIEVNDTRDELMEGEIHKNAIVQRLRDNIDIKQVNILLQGTDE